MAVCDFRVEGPTRLDSGATSWRINPDDADRLKQRDCTFKIFVNGEEVTGFRDYSGANVSGGSATHVVVNDASKAQSVRFEVTCPNACSFAVNAPVASGGSSDPNDAAAKAKAKAAAALAQALLLAAMGAGIGGLAGGPGGALLGGCVAFLIGLFTPQLLEWLEDLWHWLFD